MIRTRILGTLWERGPDMKWRAPFDPARVAESYGAAFQCETALRHAQRRGLRLPCNPGHVWTDRGRINGFDAICAIAFVSFPDRGRP